MRISKATHTHSQNTSFTLHFDGKNIVTWTRLSVTLCVHCLSCSYYMLNLKYTLKLRKTYERIWDVMWIKQYKWWFKKLISIPRVWREERWADGFVSERKCVRMNATVCMKGCEHGVRWSLLSYWSQEINKAEFCAGQLPTFLKMKMKFWVS